MATLRFVSVDRAIDPDVVTQDAEYETRVHPEGREDGDGNDVSGQEYQDVVSPELRGTASFTVVAEAEGFDDGARAQIDVSLSGGYREYKVVDLPAGEEAQTLTVEFGPGPLHHASGMATVLAYLVDADGNLLGPATPNQEGTLSYEELARASA